MGRPSKFDSAFKAKVALEALQEKETLLSLSKKYGVAPSAPIKALMGLSLPPSTKALHSTYPFQKQSTKCLTCQKMGTRISEKWRFSCISQKKNRNFAACNEKQKGKF